MEIIPVIDILKGKVVKAIKGERSKYFPLEDSSLAMSSDPLIMASVFKQGLGLNKLYIADLDSIEQKGDNFKTLEALKPLGIEIMVDMGIRDRHDLNKKIINTIDYLILGTETLLSLDTVKYAIKIKTADKVIVSIDLKEGKILKKYEEFISPEVSLKILYDAGVRNFIILDLAKVGTLEGPSQKLNDFMNCFKYPDISIFMGGGITSVEDIAQLEKIGIKGVLIGTALHKGLIKKEDLQIFK